MDDLVRNMLELIEKYSQKLDFAKNSRNLAESDLSADQVRSRLSQIIGTL